MLKKVARVGDEVRGHLDVEGNEVIGTVTSGSPDTKNGGVEITHTDGIITIPVHAHQFDGLGAPTDFRSHVWRIVGSSKHNVNNKSIARDGDGGNDADWDGYQTLPSASYIVATTTNLLSK